MNIDKHLIFLSLIFPVLCSQDDVPKGLERRLQSGLNRPPNLMLPKGPARLPANHHAKKTPTKTLGKSRLQDFSEAQPQGSGGGSADVKTKPDPYSIQPPVNDMTDPPAQPEPVPSVPVLKRMPSDVRSGDEDAYASRPPVIATEPKPGLDKLSGFQGAQPPQGGAPDPAPSGGGPNAGKKSGQGALTTLDGPKNFGGSSALYEIEFSSGDVDGKCWEKIRIKGRALSGAESVDDTFQPECEPQPGRSVYFADDEVLMGSPHQNCLVYGLEEVPDRLIVKEDNILKVKTYKDPTTVRVMNAYERKEMEQLLQDLEQQYVVPKELRSLADVDAIHKKITEFLHKFPAKDDRKEEKNDGGEDDGKASGGQTGGGGVDSEASGCEPCCCLKIINYIKDTLQSLGLCGSSGSEGEKVPVDDAVTKKKGNQNLTT